MAEKKLQSAKKKKMINNTIVHIVLVVLAIRLCRGLLCPSAGRS